MTKVEDMAYCLTGIFGIFIPVLCGEKNRAFTRLREELLKESGDLSLLNQRLVDIYATHLPESWEQRRLRSVMVVMSMRSTEEKEHLFSGPRMFKTSIVSARYCILYGAGVIYTGWKVTTKGTYCMFTWKIVHSVVATAETREESSATRPTHPDYSPSKRTPGLKWRRPIFIGNIQLSIIDHHWCFGRAVPSFARCSCDS
ncbi:hypothetical protein BDN67DRAFT_1003856 [Paxillus ammoniavirescens]|nr:hypothetical protein BDN67DRAFT_1003856 [Paxillus ammoniavirescens]